MRYTIDDKHLIKWVWVKNYVENACSNVFDKRWSLEVDGGKDTVQNINARSNFVDLWSTTRTRVSDATAVTFSIKCFNGLKLYPLVNKHLPKVVCFLLFIYSWAFNKYLSSTVSLIAVTTLYWRPVYIAASKEYLRILIIFMLLESAFSWLFYLKFSLELVTFSKSYARKQQWLFFSEHSVH